MRLIDLMFGILPGWPPRRSGWRGVQAQGRRCQQSDVLTACLAVVGILILFTLALTWIALAWLVGILIVAYSFAIDAYRRKIS